MGAADLAVDRGRDVMTAGGSEPDLSAFQLEVARLFFTLPASQGFLLREGPPCSRST